MEVSEGGAQNGDGSGEPTGLNGGATEAELDPMTSRPADVDADMREMARRKRVEAILSSKTFRAELDRLVDAGLIEGNSVGGCLQQITDMMGPLRSGSSIARGGQCVQPIADLRGAEAAQMSKGEKILRCKLASLLRIIDLFGWSNGVYNHATVRISQDLEHFLVNPCGLLYTEVTAGSLLKVDMQGNVVQPGSSGLDIQLASYAQHAAVHAARPDLRCVLQVQQPAVVSVSALRAGLLPLTEHACLLGEVSVHRGTGSEDELQLLTRDLGVHNKVILLQNRGALCCGETVEEAFFLLTHLVAACESQVRMMPLGIENLSLIDDEQRQQLYEECRQRPASVPAPGQDAAGAGGDHASARHAWRLGEIEFEALMRLLDNHGYRTGYLYRHPLRAELPSHQSDVEYPPAATSYTYDTDDIFKYSPVRRAFASLRGSERTRWLNSPNSYQKVEVLETGTNDPKKITKWVADGSPQHTGGTPIRVDTALQFVPKNTNPKEFKLIQQQIKENRRAGGISAGPQSHILEGVTWDEARQLQDAAETKAGDQVVLVGAASKGIIQRDYQHHATVYKTPYAKNPFDQVTDEDLEDYKRTIEQRSRGESVEPVSLTSQPAAEPPLVSGALPAAVPQHAERVELASDGEEADVSRSSAPVPPPRTARVEKVEAAQAPRPARAQPVHLSPHESPRSPPPVVQMPRSPTTPVTPVTPVTPTSPGGSSQAGPASPRSDVTANGDEADAGHLSTVSQTDQEDVSTSEASKKDKKKKKGLRTPSFLKKKKDKKKDKKEALDASK